MQNELPAPTAWLSLVKEKTASIQFGTVNITVHEGRVTIVEAVQKTRILSDKTDRAKLSKRAG